MLIRSYSFTQHISGFQSFLPTYSLTRQLHNKYMTLEGKSEMLNHKVAYSVRMPQGIAEFNPLKPELNSICYLLALLAHHFLHVSRIRVKSLTFRRLMSYIYMEHPFLMFLDHTQRRSTVGRTPLDE